MKLCYASFIQCLEQCARDTVEHLRDVAIKIMASLLSQHPEQEQMLLTQLVNKMVRQDPHMSSMALRTFPHECFLCSRVTLCAKWLLRLSHAF